MKKKLGQKTAESEKEQMEKILVELMMLLNEETIEETAKLFSKLGEQILQCHRTLSALAVALSEKGILTWEDINRSREKVNNNEKTGEVIDWDRLPRC